ncbi:hypothetical protein B6A27_17370 [Anoxybacillus sp. UARK-01]|jgi:hypothetical protein|uniref:DUF7674 family protein n=1 Tax=Anoxybacillus sp. UARK-01 TaxID=1895648 RepID=UPI0009BBB9DC|nr:hypothetical protein [Anoxybacillus sp. UARK-01]OQM44370.1 hypothetical protein B6A27_17370 [Anoxybacillus sp. UARK-01]
MNGGIIITIEVFTKEFLELCPEYKEAYVKHIEYNEEFLPHVFFGETLNEDLPELIRKRAWYKVKKIFDFIELMLKEGDINVQEVITMTVLARLGDEPEIMEKTLKYMGPETRKASEEIEIFWGRQP